MMCLQSREVTLAIHLVFTQPRPKAAVGREFPRASARKRWRRWAALVGTTKAERAARCGNPPRPSGSLCRGLIGGIQAPPQARVAAAAVARRRCGAWWAYRWAVLIWVCPSSTPISFSGVPRLANTEAKECLRSCIRSPLRGSPAAFATRAHAPPHVLQRPIGRLSTSARWRGVITDTEHQLGHPPPVIGIYRLLNVVDSGTRTYVHVVQGQPLPGALVGHGWRPERDTN